MSIDTPSPLLRAALKGDTEAVKLLLDNGADVQANDSDGMTPLHGAAYGGHAETVRLLLNRGADVHATTKDGWTPLHAAAQANNAETVRLLLDKGADVHAKTKPQGITPLHVAAQADSTETVTLLLNWKADVHAKTKDGWTPLDYEASYGPGNAEVATLLKTASEKDPEITPRRLWQDVIEGPRSALHHETPGISGSPPKDRNSRRAP